MSLVPLRRPGRLEPAAQPKPVPPGAPHSPEARLAALEGRRDGLKARLAALDAERAAPHSGDAERQLDAVVARAQRRGPLAEALEVAERELARARGRLSRELATVDHARRTAAVAALGPDYARAVRDVQEATARLQAAIGVLREREGQAVALGVPLHTSPVTGHFVRALEAQTGLWPQRPPSTALALAPLAHQQVLTEQRGVVARLRARITELTEGRRRYLEAARSPDPGAPVAGQQRIPDAVAGPAAAEYSEQITAHTGRLRQEELRLAQLEAEESDAA